MARRLAAAAALALLTACGGGGSPAPPATSDSPTPTATKPKPKPKPKPTTATPSATPTTPPPPTGEPLGTAEALVALVEPGEPRQGNQCAPLVPDMTEAACTAVKTAGGTLLAATGRLGDGHKAIRLLVQTPQGYVARYEGRDDTRSWAVVKVYAAPLTGHGDDAVICQVRLTDGALTYDLLTWVPGGPLVLRAHRTPLADGRLAPRDGGLDEYELATDRSFVRRRVAWDGRRFLLSKGIRSTSPPPR